MTNQPTDKRLYEKIKDRIWKEQPAHSAYRSARLIKEYKEEFIKKNPGKDPYIGKKNINEGIALWLRSKWTNQRGEIGYSKPGDIYRPNIKANKKVPLTFSELTPQQIQKAMADKKAGRRAKF